MSNGIIDRARRMADATPAERNRYADFLRVAAIVVVVLGHWLMAAVWVADGGLQVDNLLSLVPSAAWVTWVLQVMPIFFFVGGFANAASWRSARRSGTPYASWLRDRLRRLLMPILPLLVLWAPAAYIVWNSGVDPDLLQVGSQAALVPVWFLATYVLIVALAPLGLALWERWGLATVAAGALAAGAIDILSIGGGVDIVRWFNYLFVWGTVHQLGFAWADGRMGNARARLAIGLAGLVATWLLVTAGPYPVGMVGLDGGTLTNSNPPRVTLVALALFQIGMATAAEGPMRRRLGGTRAWTAVIVVSSSIMTLYLWHLTAMVGLIGGLAAAGGPGLGLHPASAAWWATRPVWYAVLVAVTLPFLAVFGRFERPRPDPRPAPPAWQPISATLLATAGLGLLARFGIADTDGLNTSALALPVIGLVACRVTGVGRYLRRSGSRSAHTA